MGLLLNCLFCGVKVGITSNGVSSIYLPFKPRLAHFLLFYNPKAEPVCYNKKAMKKLLFLLFLICSLLFSISKIPSSFAQDAMCNNPSALGYEDLSKCVDELNNAKQQSEKATAPLEAEVNGIKSRI